MTASKPIDIIAHHLNHSGVSNAAVTLANGLAEKKYNVRLVVIGEHLDIPYEINDKVSCHFLGVVKTGSLISKAAYVLCAFVALLRYVSQKKSSQLFVWGKEFTAVVLMVKFFSRQSFKLIGVNVNSIAEHLQESGVVVRWFKRQIYLALLCKVDHMVAQSAAMVVELLQDYKIQKNTISVAYPPLQEKFFDLPLNLKNAHPQEIIFVGRLAPQKAPLVTLEAFRTLVQSNDSLVLRFVGDGPLRPELEQFVSQHHMQNNVVFEGNQADVIPFMQKASVLALSSEYEGFGMVLAESIACGTPVVAFDCPVGPAEIVQDGVNGYLVAHRDAKALEERLKEALERDWDKEKMLQSVQKFHPENVLPAYMKAIDKVFGV